MIPVTDVILTDLGPNRLEALRVVNSVLNCGFTAIITSLRLKPLHIASGESLEVAPLVKRLRDLGATVTWNAQESRNTDGQDEIM
jgi:hypothetical protein